MFIQVGAFIVNLRLLDPFSLLVEQLAIAAVASYSCKWDHCTFNRVCASIRINRDYDVVSVRINVHGVTKRAWAFNCETTVHVFIYLFINFYLFIYFYYLFF